MDSLEKVNNLSKSDFISIFENVFEKTNWIAEKAYTLKPFLDLNSLKKTFLSIYDKCSNEQYLEIFNSHPQLAIEKIWDGNLTELSEEEQLEASLDLCTKEELEEFVKLNKDYKKKFNFPFIIAVSGKNKSEILDNFRKRIKNDKNTEFKEAIRQVKKIASLRLKQINNN